MKKKLLWLLLVLQVIFFLPWGLGQAAGIPPKPARDIYVVDEAGVLSSRTKQIILAYSSALAKRTKTQVVVLTVPTLDGESIEDYGLSVLREWGIGDKKENNGVLLLVATKDRKSRIEVGYGLEGVLPDGLTGRIQDQYMLPSFRKGNYDEGILNGYSAVLQTVAKGYGLSVKDLPVEGTSQPQPQEQSEGLPFLTRLILFGGIVLLFLVDRLLFGGAIFRTLLYLFFFRGGGRGGGFGGGCGFGGGSFGGGSGGGGGSSRSW